MRKALLVATALAYGGCGQKEPERTPEQVAQARCEDTLNAFVMSKAFVRERLKAPATAEFPWGTRGPDVSVTYLGGCTHEVRAYVDAENSFGAKLRSRYYAKIQNKIGTDTWLILDLRIEQH